jgi:tetratricopeptide (TPR) repeat protein
VYVILVGAALGLSIMLSLLFFPEKPAWFFGPFFGLLAFVPTVMLLSRRVGERVRPFFEGAQRLMKAGNMEGAIEELEKARRWKNWQLFLDPQLNSEIGLLHYASSNEKKAIEFLRKGYPKVSTGHLLLAAALYREGNVDGATAALERGIKFNKKSPVLYNVLAWMLAEKNQRDAAMQALARGLKADPGDETTQDNLQRLQNEKRLNLKPFGELWFMLKFETPKGMAPAPAFRKGFRQPPKGAKNRNR